jgi:hypothetical protein
VTQCWGGVGERGLKCLAEQLVCFGVLNVGDLFSMLCWVMASKY